MTAATLPPDRVSDLLADRAVFGLSDAETRELDDLLARWPGADADGFDRAAAAIHQTMHPDPAPLPPSLAAKLEAAAAAYFAAPPEPARRPVRTSAFYWAVTGWTCAATVAVGFLLMFLARPKEPTVAEKFERLQREPSALRYASAAKPNAPAGRVVWSKEKQEGYMELTGLTPNDPTKSQYQLWVVDKGRTFKEPVDGGVFDVKPDGTAAVPVRSPLELKDVALFAVTVEPPGGVVVSEAGRKGDFAVVMTPVGTP